MQMQKYISNQQKHSKNSLDIKPNSVPKIEKKSTRIPLFNETISNKTQNYGENEVEKDQEIGTGRRRIFGKSIVEKCFCFTGTIERVIKWHRIFQHHFCHFEVIASLVSIKDGVIKFQKVLLLKDTKGPILQVIHYSTNQIQNEDFKIGDKLRCIGHMTGPNILTAVSIRSASQEEIAALQRHCYIGDFAISRILAEEESMK